MRLRKLISATIFFALLAVGTSALAAECCECGTAYKLKKFYRPVVTLKPIKCTKYDYCTVCQQVLAPTTTCVPCGCRGCQCGDDVGCDCQRGKMCTCYGDPKTITVPVAIQKECGTYTRLVPCVTWVVECKCVECCKKCKEHHNCLDCLRAKK